MTHNRDGDKIFCDAENDSKNFERKENVWIKYEDNEVSERRIGMFYICK